METSSVSAAALRNVCVTGVIFFIALRMSHVGAASTHKSHFKPYTLAVDPSHFPTKWAFEFDSELFVGAFAISSTIHSGIALCYLFITFKFSWCGPAMSVDKKLDTFCKQWFMIQMNANKLCKCKNWQKTHCSFCDFRHNWHHFFPIRKHLQNAENPMNNAVDINVTLKCGQTFFHQIHALRTTTKIRMFFFCWKRTRQH